MKIFFLITVGESIPDSPIANGLPTTTKTIPYFLASDLRETNNIREKKRALAGNRTRVARVASEHSTTEPPVLVILRSESSAYDNP
jgi:hypothetical protein